MTQATTGNLIDPEAINHALHYNRHPSKIECIELIRDMPCNLAFGLKYIWRLYDKETPLRNIDKAIWYIRDELQHTPLTDRSIDFQIKNPLMRQVLAAEPDTQVRNCMEAIYLLHESRSIHCAYRSLAFLDLLRGRFLPPQPNEI